MIFDPIVNPRDYGVIPRCPYCPRTNIRRSCKTQIVCGHARCKGKLRSDRAAGRAVPK